VLSRLRPTGFDLSLGRRVVELRVLRTDRHLGVHSLRRAITPSREILIEHWQAEGSDWRSVARAYVRRVRARAPQIGYALRQPLAEVRNYRIDGRLKALEARSPAAVKSPDLLSS
jgi:hypothetical protein